MTKETQNPVYSNGYPEDLARLKKVKCRRTAILAHCMNCQGGGMKHVRECGDEICPLYHFRLGKDPYAKPRGNPEAGAENLRKYREEKKQLLEGQALSTDKSPQDDGDMMPRQSALL